MAKANPPSYVESTEMLDAAPEEQQLSQPLSSEADPDAELAMASQALVPQRNIPQSNMNPNIMQEAGSAGNQMRLAANMGEAVGNIARGIAGGDQSSDVGGQFYQNAITASYQPQKMAEEMQQFEAKTLAVTAARYELEEKDPTSEINRRYQKSIKPFLEKAGMGHLSDFVTIADMDPGGIYQAMQAAKARAEEFEKTSMLRLQMQDQALAASAARNDASIQGRIAAKKMGKGGGGGGGGGAGSVPEGFASYGEFESKMQENFSAFLRAASGANTAEMDRLGPEVASGVPYVNPGTKFGKVFNQHKGKFDKYMDARLTTGGRTGKAAGAEMIPFPKVVEEAKKVATGISDNERYANDLGGVMRALDDVGTSKTFMGLLAQDLPPVLVRNLLGDKVAGALQTAQNVANGRLREVSGAAVTDPEMERFQKAMGMMKGGTLASLKQGIRELQEAFKAVATRARSGASPAAQEYLALGGDVKKQKAFQEQYSNRFSKASAPAAPDMTGRIVVLVDGKPKGVRAATAEEAVQKAKAAFPDSKVTLK